MTREELEVLVERAGLEDEMYLTGIDLGVVAKTLDKLPTGTDHLTDHELLDMLTIYIAGFSDGNLAGAKLARGGR